MPRYDDLYEAAGRHHNVDPALIKAIAIQESGEDPTRTGADGEWGMMQFMPATAQRYGLTREQAYNSPRDAIFAAAHYMSDNLNRYTDRSGRVNLPAAVAAYNGSGPAAQNYAATVIPIYRKVAATGRAPSNDAIIADAVAKARGDQAGHGGTSAGAGDDPDVAAGMDALSAAAGGKPSSAQSGRAVPSGTSGTTPRDTATVAGDRAGDADVTAGMAVLDAARKTEPPKKEPAATPPQSAPAVDDLGRPIPGTGGTDTPLPGQDVVNRIIGAGVEGWRNTEPIVTPKGEEAINALGPVGRFIVNPALKVAGGVLGAGNALGSAGMQTVMEATPDVHLPSLPPGVKIPLGGDRQLSGELTPGFLGRDINMLSQVAPVAGIPGMAGPAGVTRAGMEASAAPRSNSGHPFSPPTMERVEPVYPSGVGPLTEEAKARAGTNALGPTSEVPPPPPEPTAGPRPGMGGGVGADVTREPIPPKTPVERARDLEKAVLQTAEERAGPGLVDDTPYVPGIPGRLLASRDFSKSKNALDEKVASAMDPAFRDAVDANKRARNEGMVDHLREGAGDLTALEQAHEARSAVSPSAMRVFEGEKPVDAANLVTKIDEMLNGPEGKQKAVRTTLNDVRASLFDNEGNLETMPSRLYGARRNLTDLLKKGVKGTGDLADDVRASKHHLEDLLGDFDPLITSGAPRFTEYLKAWSDASKPIDAMEFLQSYFTGKGKITNDAGYLQPGRVQKMFDDVLQAHKARGVNKGKSLTDDQIARIEAVRNELQADQLRDRQASTRGSDSFQQFNSRMFGEGPVINALRHARDIALGTATGGIYNLGVKPIMETNRLRRIERKTDARKRQLLEEGPRNALGPD